MLIKTKAIVLSAIKYQEKSLIVKCLTREVGIQTFFVRNAFSKGKNSQNIAYFQPMMMLKVEFSFKNKGGMEYFSNLSIDHVYQSVYYSLVKNSIALFLGEVLHYVVSQQEQDTRLYDFLEAALLWFDTHEDTANFHLVLMMELTKYIGCEPDDEDFQNVYFDWVGGSFVQQRNESCLDQEQSQLWKRLMVLGFQENQRVFSGSERKILLDILIKYYEEHAGNFKKPKSLAVLREIFSN